MERLHRAFLDILRQPLPSDAGACGRMRGCWRENKELCTYPKGHCVIRNFVFHDTKSIGHRECRDTRREGGITADDGNRTRLPSLGSWCSTNELHLHVETYYKQNVPKMQYLN